MGAERALVCRNSLVVLAFIFHAGPSVAQGEWAQIDAEIGLRSEPSRYEPPRIFGKAEVIEQPVKFSHAKHAGELALECGVCHVGAGDSAHQDLRTRNGKHMTLPVVQICINCHNIISTDNPDILSLKEFQQAKKEVPWIRVYRVLEGVNWTHKAHLDAGIDCRTCHADVEKLEVMEVATAVSAMASCLNCHRANQAKSECETCHSWPKNSDFKRWSE